MRRRLSPIALVVATVLLAGCPTDKGSRSAISTTTTRPSGPTTPSTPGGGGGGGGAPNPGGPGQDPRVPGDVPQHVVLGGTKLEALATGSGTRTEIPRPRLGNGLQVIGLLERAQGLVVVVRGPLPQDPGAVYVLGDSEHEPRSIGTGIAVVPGASPQEVWIAEPMAPDGLTPVRRVDTGQEVPSLVQRFARGRSLAGFGVGGLILSVTPDPDGEVVGPVDVMDPVKGTLTRRLANNGSVVAADGQRAVVLQDAACTTSCVLRVTTTTAERSYDLPAGLVPERGGATTAGVTVFVGRASGGPRHIWVLSLTDGAVRDTGLALPPESGPSPIAMDTQGSWAFTRSGPSTLVAVHTADAQAEELPWPLDPWNAVAVTAGGTCECRPAGTATPVV